MSRDNGLTAADTQSLRANRMMATAMAMASIDTTISSAVMVTPERRWKRRSSMPLNSAKKTREAASNTDGSQLASTAVCTDTPPSRVHLYTAAPKPSAPAATSATVPAPISIAAARRSEMRSPLSFTMD